LESEFDKYRFDRSYSGEDPIANILPEFRTDPHGGTLWSRSQEDVLMQGWKSVVSEGMYAKREVAVLSEKCKELWQRLEMAEIVVKDGAELLSESEEMRGMLVGRSLMRSLGIVVKMETLECFKSWREKMGAGYESKLERLDCLLHDQKMKSAVQAVQGQLLVMLRGEVGALLHIWLKHVEEERRSVISSMKDDFKARTQSTVGREIRRLLLKASEKETFDRFQSWKDGLRTARNLEHFNRIRQYTGFKVVSGILLRLVKSDLGARLHSWRASAASQHLHKMGMKQFRLTLMRFFHGDTSHCLQNWIENAVEGKTSLSAEDKFKRRLRRINIKTNMRHLARTVYRHVLGRVRHGLRVWHEAAIPRASFSNEDQGQDQDQDQDQDQVHTSLPSHESGPTVAEIDFESKGDMLHRDEAEELRVVNRELESRLQEAENEIRMAEASKEALKVH